MKKIGTQKPKPDKYSQIQLNFLNLIFNGLGEVGMTESGMAAFWSRRVSQFHRTLTRNRRRADSGPPILMFLACLQTEIIGKVESFPLLIVCWWEQLTTIHTLSLMWDTAREVGIVDSWMKKPVQFLFKVLFIPTSVSRHSKQTTDFEILVA